jgi:hypothetical protein
MPFDCGIARRELLPIDIDELEVLLERAEVFGAVVPGEGRHDVGFGGTATKRAADPRSMPAAWGWSRSSAAEDWRGLGERRRVWRFTEASLTLTTPPETGIRRRGATVVTAYPGDDK